MPITLSFPFDFIISFDIVRPSLLSVPLILFQFFPPCSWHHSPVPCWSLSVLVESFYAIWTQG